MSKRFYQFGPFRIDTVNHVLLRDGETLPLKPKVFDTLLVLVENRERVLDKDELMSRLWPNTVVEESNLTQNIYLLRKVLGEEAQGEAYIQTMPRRGYRFVASVRELEAESPARTLAEHAPRQFIVENERAQEVVSRNARGGSGSFLSRTTPRQRIVALSITAIALAAALAYVWTSTALKPSAGPTIKSLAVLPFKPLGADGSDEDLGFGMADTLITKLSSIRQLIVRPTSAVRKFKSPDQDPLAAGRELQVDAVLEASIQRVGDRVRVTLRLVRVSDGASLWAGKFDEQAADFFTVQDQVAEQVAQALMPQMTGAEQQLLAKHYTENTEAYRLYMLGRYHRNKNDVEGWQKAIEYFNQAIEKDSNYALAYTGLADSYSSNVADALLPKAEAIAKAKQAAMTALRLDDTLSEAHVSAGRIKAYYDWDWAGAEPEFKRAIELDPNSAIAHGEYGGYLAAVGRGEQAVSEALRARELDPLSLWTNFGVAWALIAARRYDEAIEESQKVIETFPQAHYWMGLAYVGKGRYEEASTEFEKRLDFSKDDTLTRAHLGYAYGSSGRRGQAEKVLAEFKELFKQRQATPYYVAIIYAGLGEKDQAFAGLEEARREHARPLWGLKVNPVWDGLRSDPRFADLLRHVGLPQ
ncbi:MAG: winged helix-turn-helix domain-containing protein [Pyrinomonadaceae bacterium]